MSKSDRKVYWVWWWGCDAFPMMGHTLYHSHAEMKTESGKHAAFAKEHPTFKKGYWSDYDRVEPASFNH